jgi:NADH:ubiquinone oxidoreductase subunit 6 (subunit J)
MISWIFIVVILGAVFVAAFVSDMRRAALALWVASLATGGLYLTLGAELLAVIQWIVGTLIALSLVFFSAMFGDYGARAEKWSLRSAARVFMPVIIGAGFAVVIGVGSFGFGRIGPMPVGGLPGNDLAAIGKELIGNHLISLEVLALTLFLVLIGGGIIARPERVQRADPAETAPSLALPPKPRPSDETKSGKGRGP